jgi:hypothetical protein
VNASALPKVRPDVDAFLAWSQQQPHDADTKLMDEFTVVSTRHHLILFPQRRAIAHRGATGDTESAMADGETALDPGGISVSVAALLGF